MGDTPLAMYRIKQQYFSRIFLVALVEFRKRLPYPSLAISLVGEYGNGNLPRPGEDLPLFALLGARCRKMLIFRGFARQISWTYSTICLLNLFICLLFTVNKIRILRNQNVQRSARSDPPMRELNLNHGPLSAFGRWNIEAIVHFVISRDAIRKAKIHFEIL